MIAVVGVVDESKGITMNNFMIEVMNEEKEKKDMMRLLLEKLRKLVKEMLAVTW